MQSGEGGTVKKTTVISHSRNSSDSSGYHEASVLSDNLETSGRTPDGSSTLPWRNKHQASSSNSLESPSKLARMSQASKSLCNLAAIPAGELSHAHSSTSLSSNGTFSNNIFVFNQKNNELLTANLKICKGFWTLKSCKFKISNNV